MPSGFEIARRGQQNSVSIHVTPAGAHEHGAVGIAIKRHSQRCMGFEDFFPQLLRMQRAAAVVDIAPVRLVVHGDDFRAEGAEQGGPKQAGGAIGAIENQFQSFEIRSGDCAPAQICQIFFIEREIGRDRNSLRSGFTAFVLVNFGLEVLLDIIWKLHPRSRK